MLVSREDAVLALLLVRVRTRVQVSPNPNPHPHPNQVLVFREEAVLTALLPALFGAWEVLSPGFDPTAHAALASSLLDDLQRELVYVSDKPAARRSYFRALPALLPLLGLRLCTHLGGLLECCGQLLDIEVATVRVRVRGRARASARARVRVRVRGRVRFSGRHRCRLKSES